MSTGTEVVQRQVSAYNDHDVAAFCACYHDDAVIRSGDGGVLMEGIEAIRAAYAELFERFPGLSARIEGRLEAGDWVIDREVVDVDGTERVAAAAYRVVEDRIAAVVLLQ